MAKASPFASVSATRDVLEHFGLSTKKSLGQNFLINDGIIQKILALSQVNEHDIVLEVGPGIGTLTAALLEQAKAVISIERDTDLPQVLAETLAPWKGSFALIQKDALDVTVADIASACSNPPNTFIANLPYAVAATVVLDYFQNFESLQCATVMVQKEVADRMCAQPGTKNYGAYTVKLALYARPSGRFAVAPSNFFPPPRVDSAVLRLDRCVLCDAAGQPVSEEMREAACVMADAAFTSRRKTLANSCKTYFTSSSPNTKFGSDIVANLPDIFAQAGVDDSVRGETLAPAVYVRLGRALLNACA